MSVILVTGGAGFVGSHLCERCVAAGNRVICYDNFDPYYDPMRKYRNIETLQAHRLFTLIEGDIRDSHLLLETLQRFSVHTIVHLAARPGVRASLAEPALYQEINVCGTTHVLQAARQSGVNQIVLASSSSVYGTTAHVPFTEDDACDMPASPYAASKRAMELLAYVFHNTYGIQIACLRFFTVYGPRQRPDMAIAQFIDKIHRGQEILVYGDGQSRRDYTYIDDIVDGILSTLDRLPTMGFQIINLGSARPVSLMELIDLIGQKLECLPLIRREPLLPGDVSITHANIDKARHWLGYTPHVSLSEGLKRSILWRKQIASES